MGQSANNDKLTAAKHSDPSPGPEWERERERECHMAIIFQKCCEMKTEGERRKEDGIIAGSSNHIATSFWRTLSAGLAYAHLVPSR